MLYTLENLYAAERAFAARHRILDTALVSLGRLREQASADLSSDSHKLAAWVVAPVLAVFTRWLAEQTEKAPSARCLAVMREGRLIGRLLETLFGTKVQEVWINRDLSMRAAFGCGDDEALLNWLARTRIKPLTAAGAMRQLLGKTRPGFDESKPLDLDNAQRLLKDLHERGLLEIARERAVRLSERLLKHWRRAVSAASESPLLLMDFASVGNIQRSLKTVLGTGGNRTPIVGLNFLTTAGSVWAKQAGCILHGCLAEDGDPLWMAETYARTPELIEIFAAAPEGPLQDYAENGMPILGANILDTARQKLVVEAQDTIVKGAAFYHHELGGQLNSDLARCIWGRLLSEPMPAEVETVADWPLDAGLDGSAQRVLAPCLAGDPQIWTKLQTAWPAGSRLRGR